MPILGKTRLDGYTIGLDDVSSLADGGTTSKNKIWGKWTFVKRNGVIFYLALLSRSRGVWVHAKFFTLHFWAVYVAHECTQNFQKNLFRLFFWNFAFFVVEFTLHSCAAIEELVASTRKSNLVDQSRAQCAWAVRFIKNQTKVHFFNIAPPSKRARKVFARSPAF